MILFQLLPILQNSPSLVKVSDCIFSNRPYFGGTVPIFDVKTLLSHFFAFVPIFCVDFLKGKKAHKFVHVPLFNWKSPNFVTIFGALRLMPCLHNSFLDEIALGRSAKFLISFKNILPVELKNVVLNIDVDDLADG